MPFPMEFVELGEALSVGTMGLIVFLVVQWTKNLPYIKRIPTCLWAWITAAAFFLAGLWIRDGAVSAESVYLSVVNGLLAAGMAVYGHQTLKRGGAFH